MSPAPIDYEAKIGCSCLFCHYLLYCLLKNGTSYPLQWRHNGHDGVSNHQPHHCLLNTLFKRRSMKTSKRHVTALCAGSSPVIPGTFPRVHWNFSNNIWTTSVVPCNSMEFWLYPKFQGIPWIFFHTRKFSIFPKKVPWNPMEFHGTW